MDAQQKAPWWWKSIGVLFFLIAIGLTQVQVQRLVGVTEWWQRLLFYAGAVVFVLIGVAFLKTKPQSSMLRCPSCGWEKKRDRLTGYCAQCGTYLLPDEGALSRSEINCPFCDEPVQKGVKVCQKCSKRLPGFGIDVVKGRPCCRWCKSAIEENQKFCTWCSAPLSSAAE